MPQGAQPSYVPKVTAPIGYSLASAARFGGPMAGDGPACCSYKRLPAAGADRGYTASTDAVKDAYAALSATLLCRNLPRGAPVLQNLLVECLDGFPLYQEEIEGLVRRLCDEIGSTKDEIVGDYWTEETYAEVLEALRAFEDGTPSEAAGPAAEAVITEEYSQFARNVETFEWGNVIPSNMLHGTPEGLSFVLHDTWEAEWRACSSEINASAVEQRLWTLVPATLQAAAERAGAASAAAARCIPAEERAARASGGGCLEAGHYAREGVTRSAPPGKEAAARDPEFPCLEGAELLGLLAELLRDRAEQDGFHDVGFVVAAVAVQAGLRPSPPQTKSRKLSNLRQVIGRMNFSTILSIALRHCEGHSKASILQELKALRNNAGKATEHGIFCRHARGGTKYRACISFSNLRLQARPRSSLSEAQRDLTCLASIRQRVTAGSGLFEHRVRTAMAEIEAIPRRGITFQVACAIFRHVLLSPVFEAGDFDSALGAWRRVRAAQQRPEESCMGRPGHMHACGKTVGKLSPPGYGWEARTLIWELEMLFLPLPPLTPATLLQRRDRFLADVRLESGATDVAYCVNPGRMEAFSRSEASVWLAEAAVGEGTSAPKRRLRWTWELIDHNGVLCGTNTQRANSVVGELLRQRLLPGLDDWVEMKSEKSLSHVNPTDDADGHLLASAGAVSDDKADTKERTPRRQKKRKRPVESRLDFWLRTPEGGDHYIEAKNCHMVYPDGHGHSKATARNCTILTSEVAFVLPLDFCFLEGYFPDSVSSRASRHVTELAALAQAGSQCTVIFVVQRGDLHGMVRPSSHHDPTFARACRQAAATGVRFRAVLVACSLQGLTVQREADVDLSDYDASPIAQWASQQRVANGPFPHEKKAKVQRRPLRSSKKAGCGVFTRSLKPQQEASCIDLEDDEDPAEPPGRSPAQSQELWLRLRQVYQELWLEAGATSGRASKSLERIEELAEAHLQREWESWNRRGPPQAGQAPGKVESNSKGLDPIVWRTAALCLEPESTVQGGWTSAGREHKGSEEAAALLNLAAVPF
eukprot:s1272_g9.t5